jgi:hypothetical protein
MEDRAIGGESCAFRKVYLRREAAAVRSGIHGGTGDVADKR